MAKKLSKKKSQDSRKHNSRLKKLLWSKSSKTALACLAILGLGVAMIFPVSYEETETEAINFHTEYKDEGSIELWTDKVAQEGKNGERYTTYRYSQTLFDRLFRKDKYVKKEIDSGTYSEPAKKIVLNGTRKWQYMMCSNGTYRYFTDEQFKERNTGFTSKSSDYCAENNQGKKVRLADSPSGANNATRPTYVPPDCKSIDIPYKTVYEDASWLYEGETQEGVGFNGYKYVCSDGSNNFSYEPTDKIIYRGTRQKETYTSPTVPTGPTQDYAAKWVCDRDYNSARAQLSMSGASGGSAMQYLQQLYKQCLRRAGF